MLPLLSSLVFAADLDTFRPAASAWCGGGVQVASAPEDEAVCLGVLAGYARDPLVQRWGDDVAPVVEDAVVTRFGLATSLGPAALVAVDVPYYPYLSGVAGTETAVGDIQLSGAAALGEGALRLVVAPRLSIPTGRVDAWVGAGGVGGGLSVGGEYTTGPVGLAAAVGVRGAPPEVVGGVATGTDVDARLGARWRPAKRATVGAEIGGSTPVTSAFEAAASPVEAHVYGQWAAEEGLVATVGAGTGLVAGLGAPEVRAFLGLGWRGRRTR